MPSLVMLPFIQCHQTRGRAPSGGFSKPRCKASEALCAEASEPIAKHKPAHTDLLNRDFVPIFIPFLPFAHGLATQRSVFRRRNDCQLERSFPIEIGRRVGPYCDAAKKAPGSRAAHPLTYTAVRGIFDGSKRPGRGMAAPQHALLRNGRHRTAGA